MNAAHLRVVRAQPYKLRKVVSFEEVRWASVLQILVRRHALSFFQADRDVRTFLRRVRTPFHPIWFLKFPLDSADATVARAVCEAQGVDAIVIRYRYPKAFVRVPIRYALDLTLDNGQAAGRAELRCYGTRLKVHSRSAMILMNAAALILALVGYTALITAVLYAGSVLFVWLQQPVATFEAASRDIRIGLALLLSLVALSALGGTVVRRLFATVVSLLQTTKIKHVEEPPEP